MKKAKKLVTLPLLLSLALPTTLTGVTFTVGSIAAVASLSGCGPGAGNRADARQDARVGNRVDARTEDRAQERVQDRKDRRD